MNDKKFEPIFKKVKVGIDAFTSKIDADNMEFVNT